MSPRRTLFGKTDCLETLQNDEQCGATPLEICNFKKLPYSVFIETDTVLTYVLKELLDHLLRVLELLVPRRLDFASDCLECALQETPVGKRCQVC